MPSIFFGAIRYLFLGIVEPFSGLLLPMTIIDTDAIEKNKNLRKRDHVP